MRIFSSTLFCHQITILSTNDVLIISMLINCCLKWASKGVCWTGLYMKGVQIFGMQRVLCKQIKSLISLVAYNYRQCFNNLTHWGRVTRICASKLTIIGSDNGLSPGRRQAIIWINAGILLIGPLGTNLSEILIEIHAFSLKKMHLKISSGKWPPSCLGLNVLRVMLTCDRDETVLSLDISRSFVFVRLTKDTP